MRFASKLALVLALGATSLSTVAVAAKDKKAADAAPKKNFSKEFVKVYAPAVDLLNKKNIPGAIALWPQIKTAILNDDDRYEAGIFGYNTGRQANDNVVQAEGLDFLINSTATPAEQKLSAMMTRGQLAYAAKDYDNAIRYMKQSYDGGYRLNSVEIMLSNAHVLQGKHSEALVWMQTAIDNTRKAGGVPDKQWFAQAASYAAKLKDPAKILYWTKELIKADPRAATWHDGLFNLIYNSELDNQESLDVVRLARLNQAILRENEYKQFLEYADVRRNPSEVLTLIDEGVKASHITASNVFFNEQRTIAMQRIPELKANWDQDEKAAMAATNGYDALLFGEILLSFGENTRAQRLFEAAVGKGRIVDRDGKDQSDRALMRLGISKVMQGNFAGAKSNFEAVKGVSRKAIAEYWLIHISQKTAV